MLNPISPKKTQAGWIMEEKLFGNLNKNSSFIYTFDLKLLKELAESKELAMANINLEI